MLAQDLVDYARDTPIEQVLGSHITRLRRQGRELIGPCPICGGTDHFSFHLDKQVWNCRRCGTGGRVVDLAMAMRGCDFRAAVTWLAGETPAAPLRRAPPPPPPAPDTPNWKRLWDAAVHPAGTLVEDYLRRRGVLDVVADGAFGEVLRFHPACPFGPGNKVAAMVALVRAVEGDAPVAIYRTAIEREPDGTIKVQGVRRMALGPIKSGAIKLVEDAEVTSCLGIGEGIESTLSLRLTPELGLSSVWALMNDGGVCGFPVLSGIEALWIAVDHDANAAGQKAAAACTERWAAAGCEVRHIVPIRVGVDLNDLARRAAP
jgi:hypothetical protein